ncbi:MAG: hypothetical protein ACTS4T_00485 [Candidatus Hodgkinia cicadicola]
MASKPVMDCAIRSNLRCRNCGGPILPNGGSNGFNNVAADGIALMANVIGSCQVPPG